MSIKVGKSFKALIAAGAALVMAASMAACGPSAGTPSEAKSSDTGTSSSANAKARSLDEIKKSGFDVYFADHTTGLYPQAASAIRLRGQGRQVPGL